MFQTNIAGITLSWDGDCWLGDINVAVFPQRSFEGRELQLSSEDGEPRTPHDSQVAAWLELVDKGPTLFPALLRAVFDYYLRMRPQYERAGGEWIENMPVLAGEDQLREMIRPGSVVIGWPSGSEPVSIGMSFECDWEQEHGLGVVFQDMKVVDVGGADCAIL